MISTTVKATPNLFIVPQKVSFAFFHRLWDQLNHQPSSNQHFFFTCWHSPIDIEVEKSYFSGKNQRKSISNHSALSFRLKSTIIIYEWQIRSFLCSLFFYQVDFNFSCTSGVLQQITFTQIIVNYFSIIFEIVKLRGLNVSSVYQLFIVGAGATFDGLFFNNSKLTDFDC